MGNSNPRKVPNWIREAAAKSGKNTNTLAMLLEKGDAFAASPVPRYELHNYLDMIVNKIADLTAEIKLSIADFGDKGVWHQDFYRKNNMVTFGGSLWIAQQDTDSKPGEDASWRLAVKRGQNGRDADNEQIAKRLLPEIDRALGRRGQK
jgi:hypothetical protein